MIPYKVATRPAGCLSLAAGRCSFVACRCSLVAVFVLQCLSFVLLTFFNLSFNYIVTRKTIGQVNSFVRSASCGSRGHKTTHDLRCHPRKSSFIYIGNGGHCAHTLCNDSSTFHLRADSHPIFTACSGQGDGGVHFELSVPTSCSIVLSSITCYRTHCAPKHQACRLASPG